MQYALVDGVRQKPYSKGKGQCPGCGKDVIAKCGTRKIHHWAHVNHDNCDQWWENETQWHRSWKALFPENWQEITHRDISGEIHRADIKTEQGIIVEIQNSPMIDNERVSREEFYQNMVWILNGDKFRNNFHIYHPLPDPNSKLGIDLRWRKSVHRLPGTTRGMCTRLSDETDIPGSGVPLYAYNSFKEEIDSLYTGYHQFDWVKPRSTWLESTKPVFIDFGEDTLVKIEVYGWQQLVCIRKISKSQFITDVITMQDAMLIGC